MLFGMILLMMINTNNYCAVCHSDIQESPWIYKVLKHQARKVVSVKYVPFRSFAFLINSKNKDISLYKFP